MGAVLAKFRKEKTTEAVLEELENKINEIEKYSYNTQEQKKRVVGNFLAVSIGVYVIAFIIFYFVYFPPTWRDRIIYSMPLLIFPIVIILLRRLFTWYFQRQLNKNSKKVSALRVEKKKILEQVMDKETYKVAVNLLSRFADKTNGAKLSYSMTPRTSNTSPNVAASYKPLRAISGPGGSQISLTTAHTGGGGGARTPLTTQRQLTLMSQAGGSGIVGRNLNNSFGTPQQQQQLATTPQFRSGQELRRRTPFPIINQQDKGVFERMVDVLIGDGPQDRFAMICKECFAHNGMALKEEFEYTSFRCAFCNAMNPSRKARPVAPRLPEHQHLAIKPRTDLTSSSSSSSDEDSGKLNTQRLRQVPTIELTEESNISNTPHVAAKSEQHDLEQEILAVAADNNAMAEDENDNIAAALDDDDEVVDNNNKEIYDSEPVLTDAELQERQTIEMSKLQDEFKKLMPEFEKSEDCFTKEEQELETRN